MNKITINPIQTWLEKNASRPTFKEGDRAQLVQKILNQQRQKLANPRQKHATVLEDKYLEILTELKEHLDETKTLTRAALVAWTDKALHARGLYYSATAAPPAHQHYFRGEARDRPRPYDLAFYNLKTKPLAKQNKKVHHYDEAGHPAVYYMRFEPLAPDTVLIGNLQIERTSSDYWEDAAAHQIFLRRKNIYTAMVQEALKHALENNYTKIKFQASDAAIHAQKKHIDSITITEKNYSRYDEKYIAALGEFDNACVGDEQNDVYGDRQIVYKKNKREMRTFVCHADDKGSYNNNYYFLPMATDYLQHYQRHNSSIWTYNEIFPAYEKKDCAAVLDKINALLRRADLPEEVFSRKRAAKLAWLKGQLQPPVAQKKILGPNVHEVLQKFVETFGYEAEFLKKYKRVKKIPRTRPAPGEGECCYINTQAIVRERLVRRDVILKPELGKTYLSVAADGFNCLYDIEKHYPAQRHKRRGQFGEIKAMLWYDGPLRDVFRQLKLGCRKQRFVGQNKKVAHVWEITEGLEQFKERPRAMFAYTSAWKFDTVSMRELICAAEKFGLPAGHLNVVNNWVTQARWKYSGQYDPVADKIELARPSLGIMAHEGLHRLTAQGIIPAKEYKVLVQAGKNLIAQRPELAEEIFAVDVQGVPLYPAGAAREAEYAAKFVEIYYTENSLARKCLAGEKITLTEKILGYAQALWDFLAAWNGDNAAQARNFLRRLEQNYYGAPLRIRQQPAPNNRKNPGQGRE